jgi:hypothetical protein
MIMLAPRVGSRPRSPRGGEEQGQHFIIDRQNSVHTNLSRLGITGVTGITNSDRSFNKVLSRPGSYSQFVDIATTTTNSSPIHNTNPTAPVDEAQSLLALSSNTFYGSQPILQPRTPPPQILQSNNNQINTIRVQVVIWNIGKLDVVTGAVPMTFRVSLFWNDSSMAQNSSEETLDDNNTLSSAASVHRVWTMHGRNKAYQQELARDTDSNNDAGNASAPVPPLAILNVSTFETIGSVEVDMLRESTRLMRWTCMYRATVIQEDLRVDAFPHDDHDIHLKLAILSQRSKGCQWDRRKWKLALATNDDTQQSTRIPHGMIVGQARMPGFAYNKARGLEFQFCALDHGFYSGETLNGSNNKDNDVYIKVSLNVLRESGYYDKNIVPLLALLNVVAVSVLTLKDTEFFQRGLLTLNMAFVEMSIRMTTDAHLPGVDYEIRLQRILNEFFVVLMVLVLEAMSVYVLRTYYDVPESVTAAVDFITGILAMTHNAYTVIKYYESKRKANARLQNGWQEKKDE